MGVPGEYGSKAKQLILSLFQFPTILLLQIAYLRIECLRIVIFNKCSKTIAIPLVKGVLKAEESKLEIRERNSFMVLKFSDKKCYVI